MARNKGSANLSASLEVLAGAPLDAREVVQAKADLTAEGSFPYKYIGMEVYVVAENKKYRLVGNDPTDIENWEEVGVGASSVSELTDVELTDLADGQILKWDATAHKWVNADGETSDSIQVSTMPTAGEEYLGAVVQFIGATDSTYTHNYFYECVSDGEATPTYSWEQTNVQPSNDNDASLESNVTSNLAVGAISNGTTLLQGTTFTEFVQKLLITEIAPTIGFSITKSGNVVYGSSYTETLSVNVSNMGTAKKIKKIEWYQGNTLLHTDDVDSSIAGQWSYAMPSATTDTTTFKAIVTYTKSNDVDDSQTKTASINFYYNKFYGAVSDLNPSEATVEALTTALGTGRSGTYSFTVTAGRICYAYPKSLGALTSIKDGNGFSLFDSFTRTEQTYTQNGTSVAYYRYVLTDATTVSGYSVTFA